MADDRSRSTGGPGPRWSGDGRATEVQAPAHRTAEDDAREAPFIASGNEPIIVRPSPARPVPPAGFTEYAPFWRRCLAWSVDELAKTLLYFAIVVVLFTVTGASPAQPDSTLDFAALAPRLLLSVGYDWLFWSQGWTPGTSLMGLRIVGAGGAAPGGAAAAVRAGASLLSAAALFVGYAWMLWSPRRQTWHDMLARTFVVMEPRDEDHRA